VSEERTGIFARVTAHFPGAASQIQPVSPPSGIVRPAWQVIGPAVTASVGAYLLAVTVGPQWTSMRLDLQLSTAVVWIFVAYLLAAAVGVAVGALVGRRWPAAVTVPAAVLLLPGTLLTAFAPGSGVLLLARGLTGFAAGLAWGVTAALVGQMGARRALVAPIVGGAVLLGLVFGPVTGAVVGQGFTWRIPFILAVPFELVALLATVVCEIVVLTRSASKPGATARRA
jgi:MFS family permease